MSHNDPILDRLDEIMAASVIVLARQMKAEKAARGIISTNNFFREAADEITRNHGAALAALAAARLTRG